VRNLVIVSPASVCEMVSGVDRKTADSGSPITTESVGVSSDKGRSTDERMFAVISTPRSSQPAGDQIQHQADGTAESKPRVKVEPTIVRLNHETSSTTAAQTTTVRQEDRLPVQVVITSMQLTKKLN